MDNELNYRQARTIRNRSLSDLIADELIRGKGVGGAIGGAMSLKSKARMKGIKEKFDILNIVKTLTGKSRLVTALAGKILGRSKKDIEYFTGRATPINEKGKKITGLPGADGGEDTSGMKVVLNQILKFLKKSHEKDMILREKENNLRESAKLRDDVRHKELLKALASISSDGEETATKEKKGGFLDGIMSLINGFKQQLSSIIEDIADIVKWFKLIGSSGLSALVRIVSFFSGGLGLALLGVTSIAALWFLGQKFAMESAKSRDDAAAKGDLESLRKQVEANTGATEGGELGSVDDRMKSLLKAVNTPESRAALAKLESGTDPNSEAYKEKFNQSLIDQGYKKNLWSPGFSDANDKAPTPEAIAKANAFASGSTSVPTPTATSTSTSGTSEEGMKNYVPRFTPPPPVEVPPKSSNVNNAIQENVNLSLDSAPSSAEKNQAIQNKTNIVNKKSSSGQPVPMPLVRNKEETFQRLIMNSTRVV